MEPKATPQERKNVGEEKILPNHSWEEMDIFG